MTLLSKKEFAARCGMPTKSLSVYALSRKVVYTEDQVDTEIEPNISFLEKYSRKAEAKGNPEAKQSGYSNLETEKLKQQIEKLKNENRKLSLSNEKTLGNFIPTEHADILITQLSEAIHMAWENELDDFILKFSAKNQLSRDEITVLKKEKVSSTNISRSRAVKEAKKMLRRYQDEASIKRGVGEHD